MPRFLLNFVFLIVVIKSQDHDVTSTQLVRSATNSFCFPKQFGPVNNPICISWLKEGKNYTFQLICSPDPDFSLQWCGIGFSTLFPKPLYWRMFPSEIIMLQLVNENGKNKTVLTDRYATSSTLPPCMKRQITQLINSTVDYYGYLTAYFTRPAILDKVDLQEGYTNLNRTVPMIAAISNGGRLNLSGCEANLQPHDNEWWNTTDQVFTP
jgi:hypothetical protein